jgi:DNA (cytosine-5)-methyltransferase 1
MNEKLKHLDLFSGIGGFALGLESTGGFETVGFCDNEPFAQKVLKKHWPDVPCFGDVRDVGRDTDGLGAVDIITGGFPCQPISLAGQQKATEDDRWLWDQMFRVIKEFKPKWIIAENVRNLVEIREGVVFEQVCTDLEGEGYEVQTFVLPASAVNAPHQRYRCWIVAHANSGMRRGGRAISESRENKKRRLHTKKEKQASHDLRSKTVGCDPMGRETKDVSDTNNTGDRTSKRRTDENREKEVKGWKEQPQSKPSRYSKDVANSCGTRRKVGIPKKGYRQEGNAEEPDNNSNRLSGWQGKDNWTVEPSVGRVAHGIPNRVDRLKGLGNAVVPQIPAVLGRAILEVHNG